MGDLEEEGQGKPGFARRDFLKRMAAFAFAVPVVSSFSLDAISYASGPSQVHSNQFFPNQFFGNQCLPNQFFANQTTNFHTFTNQQFPNQYSPTEP